MAVSDERHAYLRAYALFEAVQGEHSESAAAALTGALDEAVGRDWTDVGFVLAAAGVVHALTRRTTTAHDDLVARLVRQAEALDAPAFTAMALGLRALAASAAGDTPALLSDASRAVALLDDAELPPLDRCTAYLVVAAAYNTLRLWELVDDLYSRAVEIALVPEAPAHGVTVAVNRVLTRLEWALALVESGDDDGARRQLGRVERATGDAASGPLPSLWASTVAACALVSSLLMQGGPSARTKDVEQLRLALRRDGDVEVLPLLEAAWVLALWKDGQVMPARRAAESLGGVLSASSGARGFPLWVRAVVLASSRPTPAVRAQRDHAGLLGRLLWQSRRAVLASASAQITVERRQVEHDRLFRDVHTDPLTGLLNRRSFDAWLHRRVDDDRAVDEDQPTATLVLVDLDEFKQVNDTYGHGVGDEVLRTVGRLMRNSVRFGDLAMRHGGDEFALLLDDPSPDADAALERARDLRRAIRDFDWSSVAKGLSVSASIGVAGARTSGASTPDEARPLDAESIYRSADEALYAAKRTGTGIALAHPR